MKPRKDDEPVAHATTYRLRRAAVLCLVVVVAIVYIRAPPPGTVALLAANQRLASSTSTPLASQPTANSHINGDGLLVAQQDPQETGNNDIESGVKRGGAVPLLSITAPRDAMMVEVFKLLPFLRSERSASTSVLATTAVGKHSLRREMALAPRFPSTNCTPPTNNNSKPRMLRLDVLVCLRPWLHTRVAATLHGQSMQPRHRSGEFHTWSALLSSLVLLNCKVTLSPDCLQLPHFGDEEAATSTDNIGSRKMLLTEDLSLSYLQRAGQRCHEQSRWTYAVVGSRSPFFPAQRTLPLFHVPNTPVSLGLHAACPLKLHQKKWIAVLWGKTKQDTAHGVVSAVATLSKYIPVVSTCTSHCDPNLKTVNIVNASGNDFRLLLASAVLVLGINAPAQGTTLPEALSCGTFVIARGRNFGFEFAAHPLTRRIRKPAKDLEPIIIEVLSLMGYDFNLFGSQQIKNPNVSHLRSLEPFLPDRYSVDGHKENVRNVFGVDCHCVVHNGNSTVESEYVQRGLGVRVPSWQSPDCG